MAEALWTLDEILAATGAHMRGVGVSQFSSVSIDSRAIEAGALFVAILGDRFDGHAFAEAALKAGAGAALVSRAWAEQNPAVQGLLIVEDAFEALRQLARAARARSAAHIFAVTGSVGKTTTKEMLRVALMPFGAVHASVASFNNHWGVPLTLARMPRSAQFGVFEVGMNHAAEIAPLVGMVRPHGAVITAVEPVHIEHFKALSGIADAKAEIFEGLVEGGVAVLPHDNAFASRLRAHVAGTKAGRALSFGLQGGDVRLLEARAFEGGTHFKADVQGVPVECTMSVSGMHLVSNALAVLALVRAAGLDVQGVARALGEFSPVAGRGEVLQLPFKGGVVTVLDESYNANPASMRAALQVLAQCPVLQGGRRIAVLGDMLELGASSAQYHAELANVLVEHKIDEAIVAGHLMKHLAQALEKTTLPCVYVTDAPAATKALFEMLRAGDVVMIKGSNGSKMWSVVAGLKAELQMAQGVA